MSLASLPKELRIALIAVSVSACASSLATLILFCLLTFGLLRHFRILRVFEYRNHAVLLIYNLVFAEMVQGAAFALNSYWIYRNAIDPKSLVCLFQGWFLSTGDLGSGIFILAIAIHTFVTTIYHVRMRPFYFGLWILGCWVASIGMSTIGMALHGTNIYQPAGPWCFIANIFPMERLFLHYLWIFVIQCLTIVIYAAASITLRRRAKANMNDLRPFGVSNQSMRHRALTAANRMLLYPLAYLILTLPMAIGRMLSMAGHEPSLGYYCVVGGLMASTGWVDVIIYTYTRHLLQFYRNTTITNTSSRVSRLHHGSRRMTYDSRSALISRGTSTGALSSGITFEDMLGSPIEEIELITL